MAGLLYAIFISPCRADTTSNSTEQVKSYKAQMVQAFNTGRYDWCARYAQYIVKIAQSPEDKAIAGYYNGNSLVKMNRFAEARAAYLQAKASSSNPSIAADCAQAISAIDAKLNNTTGNKNVNPFGGQPIDSATQAMIDREERQRENVGGVAGDERKHAYGSISSILPYYEELTKRIKMNESSAEAMKSRPQTPEVMQTEEDLKRTAYAWKDEIETLKRQHPELKDYIEKKQLFENEQKFVLSTPSRGSLNTQPKLQAEGSDYYTRNYGVAASPAVPKQSEPNELVATPERMILDAHSTPGKTISRIVKVPTAEKPTNADLKVRGNIVPEESPSKPALKD